MHRRIVLISLGGTITMTPPVRGVGITPTLDAEHLARAVPGIEQLADLEVITAFRLPSASLTLEHLQEVALLTTEHLSSGAEGVVVVQGTDTIEETAFALDLLVEHPRPVVVTGALRGACAVGADGPANILAAVTAAASTATAGLGCLVVLNDEIHAARFVTKAHTTAPSAFRSPLTGPIGHVAEGSALVHTRVLPSPVLRITQPEADASVALIRMGLGDDGRLLRALPELGYRGVVIEGMGAGHVPAEVPPVIGDLASAMPVVLAARVESGPAVTGTYGFPGSEMDVLGREAISAEGLSGIKARLLLMLLLRSEHALDIQAAFARFARSG